jgi:ankyrin repeat protein
MDMLVFTPTWRGYTPFHLAVDVGNDQALNQFLAPEGINFEGSSGR